MQLAEAARSARQTPSLGRRWSQGGGARPLTRDPILVTGDTETLPRSGVNRAESAQRPGGADVFALMCVPSTNPQSPFI